MAKVSLSSISRKLLYYEIKSSFLISSVREAKITYSKKFPDTQGFGVFSYRKSFLLDELYVFHVEPFHLKCILYIVLDLKQGEALWRLGRDQTYGLDWVC